MSETLHRSFPKARNEHRCGSCGGPIARGERYHRWTGKNDCWEGVATLKECRECFGRYGRYQYLNPENRSTAEAWLSEAVASANKDGEDA